VIRHCGRFTKSVIAYIRIARNRPHHRRGTATKLDGPMTFGYGSDAIDECGAQISMGDTNLCFSRRKSVPPFNPAAHAAVQSFVKDSSVRERSLYLHWGCTVQAHGILSGVQRVEQEFLTARHVNSPSIGGFGDPMVEARRRGYARCAHPFAKSNSIRASSN
jgi:hypothetical protein